MKSILLTFVMLVLILSSVDAQDPAFSQFYANKLYLNPAFAGSQEGLTLSTAYRNQWSYVPGGFNTYAVSADIQEPYINSAFGFLASKDIEGEGLLTTTNVGFVYGYILKINKTANIHVGIKTSFAQKTVDWTRFTFTDQLDPILSRSHGDDQPRLCCKHASPRVADAGRASTTAANPRRTACPSARAACRYRAVDSDSSGNLPRAYRPGIDPRRRRARSTGKPTHTRRTTTCYRARGKSL